MLGSPIKNLEDQLGVFRLSAEVTINLSGHFWSCDTVVVFSAHGVYCLSTRGVEPYGYGRVVAAQLQQAAGRVDEAKKATMLRAFFRTA